MVTILNPFDYRLNPWGLLSKSQNHSKYYWYKVTEAQTQCKWKFFFPSLKRFSVFDWIQVTVAVAGDLRNTMEPSHDTGQIPFQFRGQDHQKWGSFSNRTFGDSKRTHGSEMILLVLWCGKYCWLNYTTCFILIKMLLSRTSVTNSLSLQLSSDSNRLGRS